MFMLGHRGDRSTQINFHALCDLEDYSLTAARHRPSPSMTRIHAWFPVSKSSSVVPAMIPDRLSSYWSNRGGGVRRPKGVNVALPLGSRCSSPLAIVICPWEVDRWRSEMAPPFLRPTGCRDYLASNWNFVRSLVPFY